MTHDFSKQDFSVLSCSTGDSRPHTLRRNSRRPAPTPPLQARQSMPSMRAVATSTAYSAYRARRSEIPVTEWNKANPFSDAHAVTSDSDERAPLIKTPSRERHHSSDTQNTTVSSVFDNNGGPSGTRTGVESAVTTPGTENVERFAGGYGFTPTASNGHEDKATRGLVQRVENRASRLFGLINIARQKKEDWKQLAELEHEREEEKMRKQAERLKKEEAKKADDEIKAQKKARRVTQEVTQKMAAAAIKDGNKEKKKQERRRDKAAKGENSIVYSLKNYVFGRTHNGMPVGSRVTKPQRNMVKGRVDPYTGASCTFRELAGSRITV